MAGLVPAMVVRLAPSSPLTPAIAVHAGWRIVVSNNGQDFDDAVLGKPIDNLMRRVTHSPVSRQVLTTM
jgi:hypothetical protein